MDFPLYNCVGWLTSTFSLYGLSVCCGSGFLFFAHFPNVSQGMTLQVAATSWPFALGKYLVRKQWESGKNKGAQKFPTGGTSLFLKEKKETKSFFGYRNFSFFATAFFVRSCSEFPIGVLTLAKIFCLAREKISKFFLKKVVRVCLKIYEWKVFKIKRHEIFEIEKIKKQKFCKTWIYKREKIGI